MAFCRFFIDKGVGGTFLSCFPVDQHFGFLSKKNIDTIKFGHITPNGPPILTYTRTQHAMRQSWWEDVRPDQLKPRVLQWIRQKATEAQPGDVVNMVFECHGSRRGGAMTLGNWNPTQTNKLTPLELEGEFALFAAGVQVNAISGACHSGYFLNQIRASNQPDRYISAACGKRETAIGLPRSFSNRSRGSRYEHAWIQSFARLTGFGDVSNSDAPVTTVEEHEQYIRANIHRNLRPPSTEQTPEFYASNPVTLSVAIEDLIFRDMFDVVHDPQITSRRRRIELPTLNEEFISALQATFLNPPNPALPAKIQAINLVHNEATKCDPDSGWPGDQGIFDNYNPKYPHTDTESFAKVLTALYWRGRLQSTLLDIFLQLHSRGFISLDNLKAPVNLGVLSEASTQVLSLLQSFDGLAREERLDELHPLHEWHSTEIAVGWLATMIVRGCADIPLALEHIEQSQYLGKVDDENMQEYLELYSNKLIECNPYDGIPETIPPKSMCFGFWLPHGLGTNANLAQIGSAVADCCARFDHIERVYKSFFNIPDEVLLTAEQQAEYLNQHYDKVHPVLSTHLEKDAAYRRCSGASRASVSSGFS